jgi:hypothetical protein
MKRLVNNQQPLFLARLSILISDEFFVTTLLCGKNYNEIRGWKSNRDYVALVKRVLTCR